MLSALGELRVDEEAELGWPSLTSTPLSCWSPLSNLLSPTDTDTDDKELRLTAGFVMARELETDMVAAMVGDVLATLLPMVPTEAAKLMGLVHALTVGGGAGVMETDCAAEHGSGPVTAEGLTGDPCEPAGTCTAAFVVVKEPATSFPTSKN